MATIEEKRLWLYPERVRKIKRLRKQIKDLNKALNREKAYSDSLFNRWKKARKFEWELVDAKNDILGRYVVGFFIGLLFIIAITGRTP